MSPKPGQTITKHFASLPDPRTGNATQHLLIDILTISICAVICGADGWTEVAAWGVAKEAWLRQFLVLPNGLPSHDTFGRVFARLDPQAFERCFLNWIKAVRKRTQHQVVSVDGKTLRRSQDRPLGKQAIEMVSAWASANRLVLGQVKVKPHSNAIKAMPRLLRVLELTGCIVTTDAAGCQTKIAQLIVQRGADYLLAVKKNQGQLYQDMKDLFDGCQAEHFRQVRHDYAKQINKGHGRLEIRECWTLCEHEYLDYLRDKCAWKHLQTLVRVRAERRSGTKRSVEMRYYISSLKDRAKLLLRVVRGHWDIENGLHWVLDIAFREDESRIRKDHGPENFAILRHIALNLLKQEQTAKIGMHGKRLKAGWDENYLHLVLSG